MRPTVLKLVGFLFLFFAWAIPIALCADKRFGPGAAFGAIIGVGLAIAMGRIWIGGKSLLWINRWNESVRYSRRKIKLIACSLAPLFGVILLWLLASVPVYIDAIPVGLAFNLGDAIRAALLVFLVIIALGILTNLMPGTGRFLEYALIALIAADCWRTHRYGDFSRPHYFTDWLIINGHSTTIGYEILALGLLLLLWIYSVGTCCFRDIRYTDYKKWLVTGASGILVYIVVCLWFSLPVEAPRAPSPPPITFTADPPPPSPPEPDIIALVELSKPLYIPSPTLGGYYFRTSTPDPDIAVDLQENNARLKGDDLKNTLQPKSAIVGKKLTALELASNAAFSSEINLQSIPAIWRMKIRMRVRPQLPWAVPGLVSSEIETDERSRFKITGKLAFKSNLDIRFSAKSLENLTILNRVVFGDGIWHGIPSFFYTSENTTPQLTATLQEILKPLRPNSALKSTKLSAVMQMIKNDIAKADSDATVIPVARLIAIREWLETNAIYDDRVTPPRDSTAVINYLSSDLKGGDAHVARAAVLLLRAAAIPSRIACGYFVPLEKQIPDRFIVTDQHATEWIEIHIHNFGWFPFAIHPKQVASHKQQPQLKAKQDYVFQELDVAKSAQKINVRRIVYIIILTVLGLAFVATGLIFMHKLKIYRHVFHNVSKNILAHENNQAHRYYLFLSSNLFRLAGIKDRNFGETWEVYACQIESDSALTKVAIEFTKLVKLNSRAELHLLSNIEQNNLYNIYKKMCSALPLLYFMRILTNKSGLNKML